MARSSTKSVGASAGRNLTLLVVVALGIVYVIWGSTYLSIRFADETLPPLLMAGVRFLIAGLLLYGFCRVTRVPNPTRHQWITGGIVGLCLLGAGNGTVVLVEQQIPSGVTALFVALVPLWTVVLLWLRRSGDRPALRTVLGVALGLVGVGLLTLHGGGAGGGALNLTVLWLVASTGAWAFGSVYAQRADLPKSLLMSTAVEMLIGGAALLALGLATGEQHALAGHTVSTKSLLALGYLIVFGSIVAYTAYTWLLKNASPSLVSTYAYVNPVVAVLLGWLFDGDAVSIWTIISAAIIVASVALITAPKRRSPLARAALAAETNHSDNSGQHPALAGVE